MVLDVDAGLTVVVVLVVEFQGTLPGLVHLAIIIFIDEINLIKFWPLIIRIMTENTF